MPHRAEKFTGGHTLRNYPFNIEQVNSEERKAGELHPCVRNYPFNTKQVNSEEKKAGELHPCATFSLTREL
jgi:hypothetical protein